MPLQQNPLDRMAEELAEWADTISTQIADGIKGGFAAPGAAQISERQKMAYYTQMMFGPDGQPNVQGRATLLQRLSAEEFVETYRDVITAHPELKPPEPQPVVAGYRAPDGLPATDIAPDGLPFSGASVAPPRESIPMPTGPIAPDGLPTRSS